MAQRHEIEAWVNPSAWDDQDEAQRVVDAIEESGSDDELEWARIAGATGEDELSAAARAYNQAVERADEARERLQELVVAAYFAGDMTKVKLARTLGISRPTIDKWLARHE